MEESDKQFYARADAVIDLANSQAIGNITPGDVSASAMFAVARYNAFISAMDFPNLDAFKAEREEIIRYFVKEYRTMLEDNLDDYLQNYESYRSQWT